MPNYIINSDFPMGAQLYAPGKPMTFTGVMDFIKELDGKMPSWLLTQWNSKNNIRKTPPIRIDDTVVYGFGTKSD